MVLSNLSLLHVQNVPSESTMYLEILVQDVECELSSI
jgi:hypothetical protein